MPTVRTRPQEEIKKVWVICRLQNRETGKWLPYRGIGITNRCAKKDLIRQIRKVEGKRAPFHTHKIIYEEQQPPRPKRLNK